MIRKHDAARSISTIFQQKCLSHEGVKDFSVPPSAPLNPACKLNWIQATGPGEMKKILFYIYIFHIEQGQVTPDEFIFGANIQMKYSW